LLPSTSLRRATTSRLFSSVISLRDSDHAARNEAGELLPGGEEAGVRTTVEERHAEALAGAHGHVGAELGRRFQHGQGQKIGGAHG